MNHSQLRAFHAVARVGSFTRASEVLGVSQSTLSGHVKLLETGYDTVLFHRGSRDVTLTDTGRALYEISQRYFAVESEARGLLASAKQVVTGTLRIGADAPYGVIPILAAFGRRYPQVERSVFFGNSQEVLKNVLSGASDIGILPEVPPHKRLHSVPLRADRLVVFVAGDHAWGQKRSIKLGRLADETVVLREAGSLTRAAFEAVLAEKGIVLSKTIVMGSREAVREAVASGMGVGVVNEAEFGHDSRLRKLAIKDARIETIECLICRKADRTAPLVAAFLETAQDATHALRTTGN
ncbi:MAG: LysR substrate-binding domain-containing protein [Hyphomicrobiaceae bacterium]